MMRWEEASECRRLTCSPTHRKYVFASYSLYTQSSGRVSLIDTYGGCGRVVVGVRSIKLRCPASVLQFRLLLISDSTSHKVQARALGPGLSSDPPAAPWLHQVRSTARGSTRRLHPCGDFRDPICGRMAPRRSRRSSTGPSPPAPVSSGSAASLHRCLPRQPEHGVAYTRMIQNIRHRAAG